MEEKKIVYDAILSIWNLAKEHGFEELTDKQWESLISKANIEKKRFAQYGQNIETLFTDMYRSFEKYYERKKYM